MTLSEKVENFSVVIVGGGPTGLTLAIDLGRRGVDCVLIERNEKPSPWPKFDRCNARTMESYRRLGLADRIRELGYPADVPMDVFLITSLSEEDPLVLRYPSVGEWRERIAASTDGSLPLEPYQLVSQNRTEPLLKAEAESIPKVTVRFGHELADLTQDSDGVRAEVIAPDGSRYVIQSQYLVGCDGARSPVRKNLGIALDGTGEAEMRQVIFRSEDLYERIPVGKGRHYTFLDHIGSGLVAQGDRKEFTLHSALPEDADFATLLRNLAGFDFDFEILNISTWTPRLLLADHYGFGRVFIAGDAAHQVIPTGGLGMNSGVGDALNLSWKLAGAVAGWGGPALLPSYEIERRPVGLRNREASGWAAQGVAIWRALVEPGQPPSEELLESARINHARMHGMVGAEFGYSYAGSDIVDGERGAFVDWEISNYTPLARPGDRLPHMWLSDGRAIQDLLGDDYTVLDLNGDADVDAIVAQFDETGAPVTVVRLDEPALREVYEAPLLIIRPDLHVSWRGETAPEDVKSLVARITGH